MLKLIVSLLANTRNIYEINQSSNNKLNGIHNLLQTKLQNCSACVHHNRIEEEPISIEGVLEYLGISASTYYRLIRDKRLFPRRMGNRDYYYKSDLLNLLEESKKKDKFKQEPDS